MALTPRRMALSFLAFFVVLVGVNGQIGRLAKSWDLTASDSATLSDTTREVLRNLHRRVEITAFFPRDVAGRVEAATLLARYRKANRRITFRVLDPTLAPGEAQRLGVEEVGSAAVQDVSDPKKIEIAQYAIEIDVTSAIARLLRNVQGTACFATGHGERTIEQAGQDGLSAAAGLLRDNGYRLRSVDLLISPRVPRSCSALVVAVPENTFEGRSRRALVRYLDAGGKAFVVADPTSDVDLSSVTKPWGLRFLRGIVLEADPGSHLPQDVTAPVVSRYGGGVSVVRGLGPTYFPRAMGVAAKNTGDPGLTVTGLAYTSPLAYLDRSDTSRFDPKVDVAGPIALGAAADSSEVERPGTSRASIKRTRVLVWGDVDFATNGFLSDGANARLFVQAIDWLAQPEELVTAVPSFPKVRELDLTQARSRYMLFLMSGVVPGLFVIAGALVWVIRRGR
jgi:ABC-type uncharacterized transport system involved in gliding motility auxiliary subunit